MTFDEAKTAVLLGNKVRMSHWMPDAYTELLHDTYMIYVDAKGIKHKWVINMGFITGSNWEIYQPEVK